MGSLLSGFAHQNQAGSNDYHGGNQKYISAEDNETYDRSGHTYDGRTMIFCTEPLFYEDSHKQSSKGKVHTFIVDGQQAACQSTQNRTGNPVEMIEQGYQKTVAFGVDAFQNLQLRNQRIGLAMLM